MLTNVVVVLLFGGFTRALRCQYAAAGPLFCSSLHHASFMKVFEDLSGAFACFLPFTTFGLKSFTSCSCGYAEICSLLAVCCDGLTCCEDVRFQRLQYLFFLWKKC